MTSILLNRCAKAAAILLIAGAAAGCALTDATVEIAHIPTQGAEKIAAAEGAKVSLNVADQRGFQGARIGSKRNGYGMELGGIFAAQPIDQILKNAIAQELTVRGFTVGDAGTPVLIEVKRFYADYKPGFFSAGLVGEVDMLVKVTGADGKLLFSDVISGGSRLTGLMITGADNARDGAQLAMNDAVTKLVTNQAFLTALLPQPAPAPQPAPVASMRKQPGV